MAVAKIHAIKSTVDKSIAYITNEKKTTMSDGTRLVSSYSCVPETAAIEFNLTSQLAKEIKGDYSKTGGANNLAYHLIQSFAVEDKVTPERVHQLGKEFAEKFLGGEYEYVIATHIDKGHLHNHIIFNSTSFKNYKKFRSEPYKTVAKIREISDKICEENGLSVIKTKGLPKSYIEWKLAKEGKLTWKETIKSKIDDLISKVNSYSEFIEEMKNAGIEVKEGKHIAFRAPEQERFIRGKRIGEDYTKESIIRRISTERTIAIENKINIDSRFIFKKLTDGYILSVPNHDYLLYINGDTTVMQDNSLMVHLTESKYTIMTSGLKPQGKITAEQVIGNFTNTVSAKNEISTEIPLSEYIKLRQAEKSEMLHRAAEAISYSRTEGVIYYSDYSKVIASLKNKSYDTKHVLMKLDDKILEVKNIGKLLVTYNKYLPVRQELLSLKFAKFTKQKYINKHKLELASLDYAEEQLRQLGIDPANINKDNLINQIRDYESDVANLEIESNKINDRIDRLYEAQSIVDDFVSGSSSTMRNIQRARSSKPKKAENIDL